MYGPNTFKTLFECKKIRETIGGENHHIEQCKRIPDNLGETEYFYHRKCFQKFVYAKTLLKRKGSNNDNDADQSASTKVQRRTRASSQNTVTVSSAGIFPSLCMICKKKDIKVKGIRQSLSKIVTETAERTIKQAAIVKNDLEMITAVTETDLIAKEFQKHQKCYLEYTRIVWEEDGAIENAGDDISRGSYDAVVSLVQNDIIEGQQCLSMEILMRKYIGNTGTKQERHKLKERLTKTFGDQLVFIQVEYHSPQVVITRECLRTQSLPRNSPCVQQFTIKRAASLVRESVIQFVEESDPLPWPPTVESLAKREKQYPELLQLFFKELLSPKESHHVTSERVNRLTNSFSQDVIRSVSKGKFLTPKHASVGLGLHSMTGQKLPIAILAKLGHSITYDAINEIETAQAELVEQFQLKNLNLPLQPATEDSKVSIYIWAVSFVS